MRRGLSLYLTVCGLLAACFMAGLGVQAARGQAATRDNTPNDLETRQLLERVHYEYQNSSQGQQLVEAARKGEVGTVEELLKRTAPHQRDQVARTALHYAALQGHAYIAEKLVQHTADVNAIDNDGKTPLHLAAQKGHSEMVKLLLRYGARQDIRDNAGLKPVDYAMRSGHDLATHAFMQAEQQRPMPPATAIKARFAMSFAMLFLLLVAGGLFCLLLGRLILGRRKRKPGMDPESQSRLQQLARLAERMEERIVNLETILTAQEAHGGNAGKGKLG